MHKKTARQIIFYLALLALWQALIVSKLWPGYIFPAPLKVAAAVIEGFRNHTFLIGIMVSFKRLLIGYGAHVKRGWAPHNRACPGVCSSLKLCEATHLGMPDARGWAHEHVA